MTFRPIENDDLATLTEWFEVDPDLWRKTGFPHKVQEMDIAMFLTTRMVNEVNGTAITRIVEQDGEAIGMVSLSPIPVCHIMLAPWHRGKGVQVAQAARLAAKELGHATLIAPSAPLVNWAVQGRWLRRAGFTPYVYGVSNG